MKALRTAIALLLCAALCICMFPAAFAEGEDDSLALIFPEPENADSSDSGEISFADLDKIAGSEIAFPEPDVSAVMNEVSFDAAPDMTLTPAETFDDSVEGVFYIPKNTTVIEEEAFANNVSMRYVVIPASVIRIGKDAFSGCINLVGVRFYGSEEQWKNLMPKNNDPLLNALVYFDGDVYWVPINEANFPDAAFRDFVLTNYDLDHNRYLSSGESLGVTSINCSGSEENPGHIRSLKGISWFRNLTALFCAYNDLTELDVSGNQKLKTLYCSNNLLVGTLNLSKNTQLEQLYCSNNSLSALNLTQCPALHTVYAHNNFLTNLNVSQNLELTGLYAAFNLLETLSLSYNTKLAGLEVTGNNLRSLNLSYNSLLQVLYCGKNQLTSLNVTSSNLKTLDCHANLLSSLDLSKTTALAQLNCSSNRGLSFSIANCPALQQVRRSVQPYTYDGIIYYYVDNNHPYLIYDDPNGSASGGIPINAVNFPDPVFRRGVSEFYDKRRDGILYDWEIRQVKTIDCNNLGIRTLKGIEYFTYLEVLRVYGNPLYSIDLSALRNLRVFVCYNTYISSLNIHENIYLCQLIRRITPYTDYYHNTFVYEYGTDYKLEYTRSINIYM
ncbi:MAG: leucine-rich repeat protein [Oscillospiraceae bacterium]|nr:leucine-rich repeat protein [Oscillospiraceae bacterium]